MPVLDRRPDVGFLQLSALNRAPGDATNGYYLHEVVAGWDGWSLSAPRPGLTIVHVEPPGPDGRTEAVVDTPPDEPIVGAHTRTRVEPGSLPRLRYGTSYSFRVLARRPRRQLGAAGTRRDRAGRCCPTAGGRRRARAPRPGCARGTPSATARGVAAAATRRHVDRAPAAPAGAPTRRPEVPDELLSGRRARIDATLRGPRRHGPTAGGPRHAAPLGASASLDDGGDGVPRSSPRRATPARATAAARRPRRCSRRSRATTTWPAPDELRGAAAGPSSPRRGPTCGGSRSRRRRWSPGRSSAPASSRPTSSSAAARGRPGPGRPVRPPSGTSCRPKATQLEAETAGKFDSRDRHRRRRRDPAAVRRSRSPSAAPCSTSSCPASPTHARTVEQPGIALSTGPGADTGSAHRATLADITADRGRPIGEGQYVVARHRRAAAAVPARPVRDRHLLVFYEAGSPHALPEPRALQAVTVPYPGTWPSLQPLRLVVERGDVLGARVVGHEVPDVARRRRGEQVRVAVSSTLDAGRPRPVRAVALAPGQRRRPRRRLHRPTRSSPRPPSCGRRRPAGPGG